MKKDQDKNELVKSLSKGDQNAFRHLFLSYFPKVKKFIEQLIKDETTAEDLSQDIFVKLWESKERLSEIEFFDAYLYRMAKNSVITQMKRDLYNVTYLEHEYSKKNEFVSIEEELFAKEVRLLVELTVSKMPAQRKKVFEMSRIEGLKNDEIAEKLHLSKKTIENHLNLALKEIRKTISLFLAFFFY